MRALETLIPPPVLGGLLALVMALLASGPERSAVAGFGAPAWAVALGALGVLVNVAGFRGLRVAGSTIDPTRPSAATSLVTTGIYRRTRNPMYLGFSLMLLAWGLWLRTPTVLLGPLFFILWLDLFQIRPEERALRQKFGAPYEDYCRRVRRWL